MNGKGDMLRLKENPGMKRTPLRQLQAWQTSPRRKPLLLLGARQVGKTWLLQDFGKSCFRHTAYVRFDTNARARRIFEEDYNIPRILNALQLETGTPLRAGETLLILDEIQACPAALTALKYLCEDAGELHVAAAGSLLGVEIHHGTGFPVGKVNTMHLYPMSFTEFLTAAGNELMAEALYARDWQLTNTFHEKFTEWLRYYYYIGGMPEVVSTFLETNDFSQVRQAQRELLHNYRLDFTKHMSTRQAADIARIWDAVPAQLSKENKKFIYTEAHPTLRSRTAAEPMLWLLRSGLIHHNNRVKVPQIPLSAYADGAFKVFLNDVGLLSAMCDLKTTVLLEQNRLFGEYKGALTEQYVLQQLLADCGQNDIFYWAEEKNEIDFLLSTERGLVPVEAKAERNLKAKSLHAYCNRFGNSLAVRTSMHTYERNTVTTPKGHTYELLELPLYAVSQLMKECETT